jgi:hypothetical protein
VKNQPLDGTYMVLPTSEGSDGSTPLGLNLDFLDFLFVLTLPALLNKHEQ